MSDWKRVKDGEYQHAPTGLVVKRYDPSNNGHFSLWSVRGWKGHFPTLRDAKAWVEKVLT